MNSNRFTGVDANQPDIYLESANFELAMFSMVKAVTNVTAISEVDPKNLPAMYEFIKEVRDMAGYLESYAGLIEQKTIESERRKVQLENHPKRRAVDRGQFAKGLLSAQYVQDIKLGHAG